LNGETNSVEEYMIICKKKFEKDGITYFLKDV